MRKLELLAVFFLIFPILSSSDILFLKDGSSIVGKLIAVSGDTLFFKASLGYRMRVAKEKALKIEFSDAALSEERSGRAPFGGSTAVGSLLVSFGKGKLWSKISVHRGMEFRGSEMANAIEEAIYVDGVKVFSYIDSTTDKVIRKGPDTVLKNTIVLKDIKIDLGAGMHRCRLTVRNLGSDSFESRFVFAPLEQGLDMGDIMVYPGKATRVELGVKKRKWGLGGMEIYVRK